MGADTAEVMAEGTEVRATSRRGSAEQSRQSRTKSAHFATSVPVPQGMIGTDDVEFFGEPSIRRSE